MTINNHLNSVLLFPIYHLIQIEWIGLFYLCATSVCCISQNANIDVAATQNRDGTEITAQSDDEIQYATEVAFDHPAGMVVDASGNMYFAGGFTHKIYKVDQAGILTTIAGTGSPGFYGEGVPAKEAQFNVPQKLHLDSAGNLYIADTYNSRIRRIDSLGIITTVAGNGSEGFFVNGGPATEAAIGNANSMVIDQNGNIFISSFFTSTILKMDTQGSINIFAGRGYGGYEGDGGPAVEATLFHPADLALDSLGNLYIAEIDNQCIRRVDQQGIISTVAGNGEQGFGGDGGLAVHASFNGPRGIYVDEDNNLYIAEQNNNRVRKVDPSGIITTIAGNGNDGFSGDGGLATQAELYIPIQVSKDKEGNLYIADVGNHRIRKVDTNGINTTVIGNGESGISVYPKFSSLSTTLQKPSYLQQSTILIYVANGIIIAFAAYYFLYLRHKVAKSKQELFKEKEERLLVKKEMQLISEWERNRIGQDLHDGVIQQLTGVKIIGESFLLGLQSSDTVFATQYVQRLNEHLMQSIQQLRGLSKGLYPVDLHRKGLPQALQELANTAEKIYGVKCTMKCDASISIEDEMKSINLFRIVQEALNNALKHADAKEITIDVQQQDNGYSIAVNDNGIGFQMEKEYQTDAGGMGLKIMKYRADIIGADLSIMSQPGQGTTVQCTFQTVSQ